MLKAMRDSFHHLKWTLFAVIVVFVLGFVFFSGGDTTTQDPASQVIARVGEETITAGEFNRRYQGQLQEQQRMYQGNLSPELVRALDLPRQVLDNMIERILRLEAARRLHLKVTNEELRTAIAEFDAFQANGQFVGKEKYLKFLRGAGYTAERFEEEIREGLLIDKYAAMVKASVLVPDSAIQQEFSSRNEKASIEYVKISSSRLETGGDATEADWKSYYSKHQERYRTPLQRRIKYLLIDGGKVRGSIATSDADLKAEYEKRKSEFAVSEQVNASHILIKTDPAQGPSGEEAANKKAEALAAQAKRGEDFAKLANENTEDPSGKGSGGQLPPFGRGQMVPEFDEAAFAMAPEEVRGPIKTQFGYHVIKLHSKIPARTRPFEEVRAQLASELAERRSETATEERARELAGKIKGLKNTSDEELRKLQDAFVTFNETPWVSKSDTIPGVGANPRFSEEAWALKLNEVSGKPVSTSRGPAFVKPTQERPPGSPPFEEVRARVIIDFQTERRDKEARELLGPVAKELASGATLASIASRYETEVKTTPEFGPGGPVPEIGTAPELSDAVFQTAKGQTGPPVAVPGGFVLFRVVNRTSPDPSAFQAQKAELVESLRGREAERLLRSYIQQVRADREVEVNEELLQSFLPEPGASRRG